MKRTLFTTFFFAALLFAAGDLLANPPQCPQNADRLEDFASCMRPYPNGRGQVLVGSYSGNMDHHTAALMNSMHRSVSAPQVVPPVPAAISFASTMATAAIATYRNPNFYGYYMWANPGLWMGARFPIYP